eukprot:m.97886 g.97886  ORF g.97886 m.97886 type:complete len:470 (-) comp27019_c0_seq1:19-1428(-)
MASKEELLEQWRSSQFTTITRADRGLQGSGVVPADAICTACFNGPQTFVLSCGHRVCRDCARSMAKCHDCGKFLTGKPQLQRTGVQKLAENAAQHSAQRSEIDAKQIRDSSPNDSETEPQSKPTTQKNVELFDGNKDLNAPMCEFCALSPTAVELGCGHQACWNCSNQLHACTACGKLIINRTVLANKYRSKLEFTIRDHRSDEKRKQSISEPNDHEPAFCAVCNEHPKKFVLLCDGGCKHHTCGSCLSGVRSCLACGRGIKTIVALEDTFSAASPERKLALSKERICQICENRPRAAVMTCKTGCRVDTCGPCTAKHRKCFLCERKVKDIRMLHEGVKAQSNECDVCGIQQRKFTLKCKMGCRFRVCLLCTRTMKQCCGFPLKNVGTLNNKITITDSPEHQQTTPLEELSPGSLLNVSRKLFDRVSEPQQPSESDDFREYKNTLRKQESIEMLLPPIHNSQGGFMGYL